jgi:ribosomal protein L7/L12
MRDLLMNPMFLVFLFLTVTNVAIVIGHYWHKIRKLAHDSELKREMIARGLTADEIREMVAAMNGRRSDGAISERVKQLAADPSRKIEAIREYRRETGAGLAEAKSAIESLAEAERASQS